MRYDDGNQKTKNPKIQSLCEGPETFGFFGFPRVFLVFLGFALKKPCVFLDFCWKTKKTQGFFVFLLGFWRKTKKTLCFFGFLLENQKTQGFFGFSAGFLVKNQKKPCFFWFLLENQKKPWFRWDETQKTKKNLGKPKNPKIARLP